MIARKRPSAEEIAAVHAAEAAARDRLARDAAKAVRVSLASAAAAVPTHPIDRLTDRLDALEDRVVRAEARMDALEADDDHDGEQIDAPQRARRFGRRGGNR